jgi:hypothetical protein
MVTFPLSVFLPGDPMNRALSSLLSTRPRVAMRANRPPAPPRKTRQRRRLAPGALPQTIGVRQGPRT